MKGKIPRRALKLVFEWLDMHKDELLENWTFKIKIMLLKVTNAKYIRDYKIELLFNDGLKGVVDLKDSIKGLVFKPLQNIDYFKKFNLNRWTIEWDCDADFAPEYLHGLAIEE